MTQASMSTAVALLDVTVSAGMAAWDFCSCVSRYQRSDCWIKSLVLYPGCAFSKTQPVKWLKLDVVAPDDRFSFHVTHKADSSVQL